MIAASAVAEKQQRFHDCTVLAIWNGHHRFRVAHYLRAGVVSEDASTFQPASSF